jgi:hypothetical protein
MRPYFSEFSYGFALTYELVNNSMHLIGSYPVFPSLVLEGRPGGGFDVHIPIVGAPIFLQFKLSHKLQRTSAAEWSLFNQDYFRMYLRSSHYSRQHNLLLQLESNNRDNRLVLYATPLFHSEQELANYFLSNQVVNNSAFFRPSDIGRLPDALEHYVVFNGHSTTAYLLSDPKKIMISIPGSRFKEKVLYLAKKSHTRIDDMYFAKLLKQIETILKENRIKIDYQSFKQVMRLEKKDQFEHALSTYLLRTYFGAELLVIGVYET